MIEDIQSDFKKFIGEGVVIVQHGFLEAKYLINKLNYSITYDVINITDEKSENYLKINLNQIYKIENNEKEIKLYLDNDIIVSISI